MVTGALPRRLRLSGSRWRVAVGTPDAVIEQAMSHLASFEAGQPAPMHVYKRSDRKVVFSFDVPGIERSFVTKVWWLHKWRRVLKRRQFGMSEAGNMAIARQRGVPVSRLEAVGYACSPFGVPRRSVLVVECLRGYRPADVVLRGADASRHEQILGDTLPVFEALYRAGCHHMDVNPRNIMLSDTPGAPPMVLDFQLATFFDQPSPDLLMFAAACFARDCARLVDADLLRRWILELLSRTGLRGRSDELIARFEFYRDADLSRESRRAMRP